MTDIQREVIEKISAQQGKDAHSYLYQMGEQLKEICTKEPDSAEMVLQDMANTSMSLAAMEKKITADIRAKRLQVVSPPEMEERIRDFYHLPKTASVPQKPVEEKKAESAFLSIFDLMEVL